MEALQIELNGAEAEQTGSRSLVYCLLACGFRFPSPAYYERVKKGQFADEVKKAIANLPYDAIKCGELGPAAPTYEEFQSHYIALFEVGGDFGPPCPLYEGEFGGGRMKVMEEVLRFYHHFGLRLSTVKRDRPDHLSLELEFMHALAFKEAEALTRGRERKAYVQAQRDFLRFHLRDFVSAVAAHTAEKDVPFYSDLARLAESFCRQEAAYLLAASPGE